MLQAVLFDLDGVITDTAHLHYRAWKSIADDEGIEFNEQINERLKGVSRMDSLNILMERRGREYTPEELQMLADIKNTRYVATLETLTPQDLLPGIHAFLQLLKEEGIPTALVSVSKNTDKIIDKLGIRPLFGAIVTGNDVTRTKPDPEGFLLAAQRLGVPASGCVVVEDAEAGLIGAKRAGMKGLGIGDARRLGAVADAVLSSTAELTLEKVKVLMA